MKALQPPNLVRATPDGEITIIGKGGFGREVQHHFGRAFDYLPEMITSSEYYPDKHRAVVVCIGDPIARRSVVFEVDSKGNPDFATLDFADSWNNLILFGSIICPGVQMTVGIQIGCHVIVNLNCTIGHDAVIGNFTTLSPGVHVSGNVHIGKRCYIGSGAVIREGVTICDDVVIGAGAAVVKDITEPGTYAGVPAKRIDNGK